MYSTVLIMLRYTDVFILLRCVPLYSYVLISHPGATALPQQLTSKSTAKRLDPFFPADHRETLPFVPVIQRSADDSSNSRENTTIPTLNQIPSPPATFSPSPSLLTCNPSRHRHSIPSALKYQPVRCVLPVGGLCRRGADS